MKVSKLAWLIRFASIGTLFSIFVWGVYLAYVYREPMLVLIGLIPLHQMIYLYAGWVKYRTPATGQLGNDKVAVIVPVYNQRDIIERVIDSIFASTYKNLEVIVVNDGSKDGTTQVLDRLKKEKYGNKIELIHQENAGKRKAVAQAFQKNDCQLCSAY